MNTVHYDAAETYYDILGIERKADIRQIKSAYRKLALRYHPDRNPGDRNALERFKGITEAYGVLIDAARRVEYDQFLARSDEVKRAGTGFSGYRYEDLLRDMFRNQEAREVFEQMAKGGSIRMNERFMKQIFSGGFLFGGIFIGFWGISSCTPQTPDGMIHMGNAPMALSHMFALIMERLKAGVSKTVRYVKGCWDSIGGGPAIEDKRFQTVYVEITPLEARQGTTKSVSLKTPEGTRRYRIKVPGGIKDGVRLRIRDEGLPPCYLVIKVLTR
ncbi:MAG: DnaJ domain-containing protein [bacterium]